MKQDQKNILPPTDRITPTGKAKPLAFICPLMKTFLITIFAGVLLNGVAFAQIKSLDEFESLTGWKAIVVNGKRIKSLNAKEVIVNAFPAKITMQYEAR